MSENIVWRSPNDVLEDAKRLMIDGREPQSEDDWILIVNCLAYNFSPDFVSPVLKILKVLYDIPLSYEEIEKIVEFQQRNRENVYH